jgi:hypothetical protein
MVKKMNKLLIKKFIRYKLNAADVILDWMPLNKAEKIKDFGKIILDELNEHSNSSTKKERSTNKSIEIL